MTWWKSAVVYQIYPRSFSDSDGDGIGDVRGIIDRLDHLADLGVDVIWLSPIYRSPQDDNGYDISDYTDIDPLFGSLADVDELIAALHRRGMKLVMDLVVNHTSDEHPWFVESRDPASPKRDWYVWRPPREGFAAGSPGAEPTNWGSYFMGPAWELDERSGEYFLHLFSRKQPDLNWENPEVRSAVFEMMNWWVDRGVDGFRMDVINLISKTLPLADGVPAPGLGGLCYDPRLVSDGPRLEEFLKEMNAAVGITARQLFTVGEMLAVDVEHARRYTAQDADELGMVFTFEHMDLDQQPGLSKFDLKPLHLPDLKANLARWQHGMADDGWNSLYWNNHDQPRIVSRFGDDSDEFRVTSAKTLGTVLHMLRGTPYVYQGEELGMTNAGFSHHRALCRHRIGELPRSGGQHRAARRRGADRPRSKEPGQRPHPHAVGRLTERRLHQRGAVAPGQSQPHGDQCGGGKGGCRLGLPPLPSADRVAARARDRPRGQVRTVPARARAPVRLHPQPGRTDAAGDGQHVVAGGGPGRVWSCPTSPSSELLLATHAELLPGALRPWESRIHLG